MDLEKLYVLTGAVFGSARIALFRGSADIALILKTGAIPEHLEAYIVGARGEHVAAALDKKLRGSAKLDFEPVGVLILGNGRFIASGGLSGRKRLEDDVKRDIRIMLSERRSSNAPAAENREKPAERLNTQAAPVAPQARSEALERALEKARRLFDPALFAQPAASAGYSPASPAAPAPAPPGEAPDDVIRNPFPNTFPNSKWRRVMYPGAGGSYLEGTGTSNGRCVTVHAIPGEYAPVPPLARSGFKRFLRAVDGSGFWVRVRVK